LLPFLRYLLESKTFLTALFFVMPLAVCMPVVHCWWPKLCMRFVVQMAVLIKIPVCRDSMLCALVYAYWSQCLTGASHLHVLGFIGLIGVWQYRRLSHSCKTLCSLNLILCFNLHIM
jgi:hypothetical protein